jgi:hypothetical protein
MGAQAVSVTFTSDDSRPTTDLRLINDPAQLPPGWSGEPSDFKCIEAATGSACRLQLTYAPMKADAGTLVLKYAYDNNAGQAKTGTVNIPYRAATDDNVIGTPSEASVAVTTGTSTAIDVIFTTDDGNAGGNLSISSGLTSLPAGWSSGSSSFNCAAVGGGAACKLSLNFAPTAPDSGTLTLIFGYINNAGIAKTGTVAIAYSAADPPP